MKHVLGRGKVFKMFEMEPQKNGPLVKPKGILKEVLEWILKIGSDVWLTVHRNSVWIRKTN